MLATFLHCPELAVEKEEAQVLANAVEDVQRCYTVRVLSPEVAAWIGLGTAVAAVYGPRVIAVRNRRAASKARPVTIIHAPAESSN